MAAIKRSSPLRGSVSASSPQSQTQSYQPAAGKFGFLPRRPNIGPGIGVLAAPRWQSSLALQLQSDLMSRIYQV